MECGDGTGVEQQKHKKDGINTLIGILLVKTDIGLNRYCDSQEILEVNNGWIEIGIKR